MLLKTKWSCCYDSTTAVITVCDTSFGLFCTPRHRPNDPSSTQLSLCLFLLRKARHQCAPSATSFPSPRSFPRSNVLARFSPSALVTDMPFESQPFSVATSGSSSSRYLSLPPSFWTWRDLRWRRPRIEPGTTSNSCMSSSTLVSRIIRPSVSSWLLFGLASLNCQAEGHPSRCELN